MKPTDYARLDWRRKNHHERYTRFIERMPRKLRCQECGGIGEYVDEYFDLGDREVGCLLYPRYEPCVWCEATGYVTPHLRGLWLRLKRAGAI